MIRNDPISGNSSHARCDVNLQLQLHTLAESFVTRLEVHGQPLPHPCKLCRCRHDVACAALLVTRALGLTRALQLRGRDLRRTARTPHDGHLHVRGRAFDTQWCFVTLAHAACEPHHVQGAAAAEQVPPPS